MQFVEWGAMAILTDLTKTANPIFWHEQQHQKRVSRRFRRVWWLPYLIVFALLAFVTVTLQDIRYGTRETGMFVIWVIHASAALFSIHAGANVISREHVSVTWDALVLTGISARQILIGKWRAALRRAAPWVLILGIARLAMIPIFTLAVLNRMALWFNYNATVNSSRYYDSGTNPFEITILPWAVSLAVLLTVLLTILEVVACTALGMAVSAVAKRGGLAMVVAGVIRFAPVAIFAGFTLYAFRDSPYRGYRWWRYTPFSLADTGSSALSQLSLPEIVWTRGRQLEALPGIALALGLLLIILFGSLAVALHAIRRSGALAVHAEMRSVRDERHSEQAMDLAGT